MRVLAFSVKPRWSIVWYWPQTEVDRNVWTDDGSKPGSCWGFRWSLPGTVLHRTPSLTLCFLFQQTVGCFVRFQVSMEDLAENRRFPRVFLHSHFAFSSQQAVGCLDRFQVGMGDLAGRFPRVFLHSHFAFSSQQAVGCLDRFQVGMGDLAGRFPRVFLHSHFAFSSQQAVGCLDRFQVGMGDLAGRFPRVFLHSHFAFSSQQAVGCLDRFQGFGMGGGWLPVSSRWATWPPCIPSLTLCFLFSTGGRPAETGTFPRVVLH